MIKQKALDVSRQVEIYLAEHSNITAEEISRDLTLAKIAVQPVGETGYTCLYEKETGIMRFHTNPELTNFDMHDWKDKLLSWWKIFEPSLDGSVIGGYYDWEDADGNIRKKFMYMVPVERTRYVVAATTYIDEFLKPSQAIRNKVIALEQLPLVEALGQEVDNFSKGSGVKTNFDISGDKRPLSPDIESTLLRICQEALANVRKHAQATEVEMSLAFEEKTVRLSIQDNGIGFDTETPTEGAFGLISMRERARLLGGTLVVQSEKGKGTLVEVTIPLS